MMIDLKNNREGKSYDTNPHRLIWHLNAEVRIGEEIGEDGEEILDHNSDELEEDREMLNFLNVQLNELMRRTPPTPATTHTQIQHDSH